MMYHRMMKRDKLHLMMWSTAAKAAVCYYIRAPIVLL